MSAPYTPQTIEFIRAAVRIGSTLAQVAAILAWDGERLRGVCRKHQIDLPDTAQPKEPIPKEKPARDPKPYRPNGDREGYGQTSHSRNDGPFNHTIAICANDAMFDVIRKAAKRHDVPNTEILRRVLIGAIRDGRFDSYCAGSSYFPGSKVASASSKAKTED